VELVRQEANYSLAVVEHQRPVRDEEIVVLSAVDDFSILRRVIDEIFQSLPEAASAVDLVFDACHHVLQ
jgi:hypothetical protein